MSKIKKVLAVFLTLAMVLGMGMTTFAAPEDVEDFTGMQSKITVSGLSENAETTVKIFQIAKLQYDEETNAYSWALIDGVPGVKLENGEVSIEDSVALKAWIDNAASTPTDEVTSPVGSTSVEFSGVNIGAYAIFAYDTDAEYSLMVANTYDRENSPSGDKLAVKDANVVAKAQKHTITKETSDTFAHIGQDVDFTVTAIFPTYKNETTGQTLNQFIITDEPTGVRIDPETIQVVLGASENVTGSVTPNIDDNGMLTLTFGNDLLVEGNSGKLVTITYTGKVMDVNYNNSVNGTSNTVVYDDDSKQGYSAELAVVKVDAENQKTLAGAEFNVYKGTKNTVDNNSEALKFVEESKGIYRLATDEDKNADVVIKVDDNGNVLVKGLDEGKYWFKETKAPNGYTINEAGVQFEVTDQEAAEATEVIHKEGTLTDTKLSSLPSTGGIGTTIFTIGGCLIMIIAAALFFASRRKENK